MTKITKKDKRRLTIWLLIIFVVGSYLSVFVYRYWSQILLNNQNKIKLEEQYESLLNEEEHLNNQYNRLQDPEFVARFARERFMYSKEGEFIIRIAE